MTGGEATATWAELRAEAARRLARPGLRTAPQEPRWLVEEAAGERYESVAAASTTERAAARFEAMLARREGGEPVQYVLGHWAFRTLDLLVDRRVLIPRPETELVAGVVIDEVLGGDRPQLVVDLGTGSGAIALSVAAECAGRAEVWATDRSRDALEVARANTAGLGRRGSAVRLVEGDWFDALPAELRGRTDVVVSNPPYVCDDDALPADVASWEPPGALRAGADGLDDLRHLAAGAGEWLGPGGLLVLELAPEQAGTVAELLEASGLTGVEPGSDLTGRTRWVRARAPAAGPTR